MNNTIDENLVKLKNRLDPMLEATDSNFKKVKNTAGVERMWIPLFLYFPFKQLLSLVTLGKFGMKVSKVQITTGTIATIIGIAPFTRGWFRVITDFLEQFKAWEFFLYGFIFWYLITAIYTFLQMPNWKNQDLFHIDAYRIFRPNEYAIVEPFLGTNFSIESINNFMLRNSNERAIQEIKSISDAEVTRLEEELDESYDLNYAYEQNLLFLNNILINLNENISHIANGTLSYQHLYIMDSRYCVYEVKEDEFDLLYKEFPRTDFEQSFNGKDVRFQGEPYVKCYYQNEGHFFQGTDSYTYKIFLEKQNVYWIITFYPKLDDEQTLQALLQDSILKGKEGQILKTANLLALLESHSKIISERLKVTSK